MPTNITAVDIFTDPVVAPSPGELITSADRVLTAQALANRSLYAKNRTRGGQSLSLVPVNMCAAYITQEIAGDGTTGLRWVAQSTSATGSYKQHSVFTGYPIIFDLEAPIGVTITSLTARVIGKNGATVHGSLPATLPILTLEVYNPSTNTTVVAGTTTDTSPNLAAYETQHSILVTPGAPPLVDGSHRYVARLKGETDANSVADTLVVTGIFVSWTAP